MSLSTADEPPAIPLRCDELTESSGLATSNRNAGYFWTHNDSGGLAKLYAFDARGALTGSMDLVGAKAIDWEDMASFVVDDQPRVLVADTGDNLATRVSTTLYVFDEPDPTRHTAVTSYQSIIVRYPDGPRDCEAVGVDQQSGQIVFLTKSAILGAACYSMPLPARNSSSLHDVTLKRVGDVVIPMATAMDIDQRTGDVVVCNYFQSFLFTGRKTNSRDDWIATVPVVSELPRLKQIEAIAFDASGQLWVTSEGSPAIMVQLPEFELGESREQP